jgi:hypothetical protein
MNKTTCNILAYRYAILYACDKYNFGESALFLLIVFNDASKALTLSQAANILERTPKSLETSFNLLESYIYIKSSTISISMLSKTERLYYITPEAIALLNDFYQTFDKKRRDLQEI